MRSCLACIMASESASCPKTLLRITRLVISRSDQPSPAKGIFPARIVRFRFKFQYPVGLINGVRLVIDDDPR